MKRLGWLLTMIIPVCLIILAYRNTFSLISIPGQGFEPILLSGDRIVVNKWSYGLRAPFCDQQGYKKWCQRQARRDEWVAFNPPIYKSTPRHDTSTLYIGNIMARPADTVWLGTRGHASATRCYEHSQIWPLTVPGQGMYIKVHPWDAALYAQTLRQYEGIPATVRNDSLCIGDSTLSHVRFQQDYYWITSLNDNNLSDSRTMGFIPSSCLIGRLELVLYSLEGWMPRRNRFFLKL